MTIATFGIICGFLGALLQAINYSFSKDCQEKYNLHGLRQLVAVHIFMLFLSGIPFIFWFYRYITWELFFLEILVVAPYMLAQYAMIKVFDRQDASIVSPLMTLKIPILAIISLLFLGKEFGPWQYVAIACIIALGIYFSSLSGRVQPVLLIGIITACTSFCISDIMMTRLTHTIDQPRLLAVCIGNVYEYLLAGLCMLPLMRKTKIGLKEAWQAKWVGITWWTCTIVLIVTFNVNGVVEGNIIQTLRSVMGIIISYLFYRKYIKDHNTFYKKIFITIGMFAAVGLYYIDDLIVIFSK